MEQYLIAANSKRSLLIFNLFRPIDLAILGTGAGITFILLLALSPDTLLSAVIVLAPLLVCAFLVIPVANYHNILCVIQNIIKFYFNDVNEYKWIGWRFNDEYK